MPAHVTVGEAARRARLTPKAIRLYEARGLLPAVARTPAGYRLYSDDDVTLLRFIGQARALGLPLAAIQRLVELRRNGTPPDEDVLAVLAGHLRHVDEAIDNLEDLRSTLAAVLAHAAAAVHGGGHARLCRILDGDRRPLDVERAPTP